MTKSGTPLDESDDAFWEDATAPMICEEPDTTRVYDLEERTARFGETVIPQSAVTHRIINQLFGAGTSVGANYVEADDAISKKEFLKSIGTCKKETREVKHFLRMSVRAVPELKREARRLWLEARELHLIFAKRFGGAVKMDDVIAITSNQGISSLIRASSLVRHSSFVIRHFEHAR
jgi:four helix bundle protein